MIATPFRGELPNPVCLPREFFLDPVHVVFPPNSSVFPDFNLSLRYLVFVQVATFAIGVTKMDRVLAEFVH